MQPPPQLYDSAAPEASASEEQQEIARIAFDQRHVLRRFIADGEELGEAESLRDFLASGPRTCQEPPMLQAERLAVRGVVVSPAREVLLLRACSLPGAPYWFTPGGGLESGESDELGLRRELREELSLADFELGPLLFRRRFQLHSGRTQLERIYLVRCPRFDPTMDDVSEARYVDRLHWWALSDLSKTDECIYPADLAAKLQSYFEECE